MIFLNHCLREAKIAGMPARRNYPSFVAPPIYLCKYAAVLSPGGWNVIPSRKWKTSKTHSIVQRKPKLSSTDLVGGRKWIKIWIKLRIRFSTFRAEDRKPVAVHSTQRKIENWKCTFWHPCAVRTVSSVWECHCDVVAADSLQSGGNFMGLTTYILLLQLNRIFLFFFKILSGSSKPTRIGISVRDCLVNETSFDWAMMLS